MSDNRLEGFREYELLPLIEELLPLLLGVEKVFREPAIAGDTSKRTLRPDFMGTLGGDRIALVEVKGVTPNTRQRLEDAANQLITYRDAYKKTNPDSEIVLLTIGNFFKSPALIK
jgi:predicted aconitase